MERDMALDAGQLRTFPIHIKDNGRVHDPDCRKTLHLGQPEQVLWVATAEGTWRIYFDDSPFDGNNFQVTLGSPTPSGKPRNGAALGPHKYKVFRDQVEQDDPDILIES
jgi:hypothetical protein